MGKTKSFNACTNYALDHKGKKNLEIENFYISVVLLDSYRMRRMENKLSPAA